MVYKPYKDKVTKKNIMRQLLIADDHPLFRAAIKEAVKKILADTTIVEAGSLDDAKKILEDNQEISLLLLDLYLPDVNGFSGLLSIKNSFPCLPVIVISACDDAGVIMRSIQFGASGFIPKTLSLDEISHAIEEVIKGEIWIPTNVEIKEENNSTKESANFFLLTPTQLKVLVMLKKGLLNKQIAYEMNISEATVKAHITAIFRKLNVRSRTQAAMVAQSLDIAPNI